MAYLLIVDDDPDFSDAVSTVCVSAGHEVSTVHSLAEARESVASRRPDAILLDVMFPEDPSGGFKLARELRRHHEELPILLLTAVNQKFPLGFTGKDIDPTWLPVTGFVEKPVEFPVLLDKINELLTRTPPGAQATPTL